MADGPASFDPRLLEPGSRIGPYRVVRRLAAGGQGVVHVAEDLRLDRLIALKLLLPQGPMSGAALERFRREARLAARVAGDGVCRVLDVGLEATTPWIAMEFVEGAPLSEHLRHLEGGPGPVRIGPEDTVPASGAGSGGERSGLDAPVARLLGLFEDAARVLDRAHSAGVVHRDLKPANLMVTPEGRVVLLDFGMASAEAEDDEVLLTRTGDVFGTPAYMAPEQLDGAREGKRDPRIDVWALGVSLFECLTGRRPFDAPSRALLQRRIRESPPDPVLDAREDLPADLKTVVATALEKNSDDRYASAEAFADDLARLRAGEPIAARPIGRFGRFIRWVRREPALAGAFGLALVFLLAGIVTTAVQASRAETQARRAESTLVEWERLADRARLDELHEEYVRQHEDLAGLHEAFARARADRGVPAVQSLDDWIARAEELAARLPQHRRALDDLGRRARRQALDAEEARTRRGRLRARLANLRATELAPLAAVRELLEEHPEDAPGLLPIVRSAHEKLEARLESEERGMEGPLERHVFARKEDQARHDRLAALVEGLESFVSEDPQGATIARARRHRARLVRQLAGLEERAEAWAAVRERVIEAPDYGGLELPPQPGLVPLGPDPDTGLEEFAVEESGEIPRRDEEGSLDIGDETAMVLVLVPGHESAQGAKPYPPGTKGRPRNRMDPFVTSSSAPPHDLHLPAFFIGKHEVTQAQYLREMHRCPSVFSYGHLFTAEHPPYTLRHPVENVDWHMARSFCHRFGLELPTEARWEAACRGGTRTLFFTGDHPHGLRGFVNIDDEGSKDSGRRGRRTARGFDDGYVASAPIGRYAPNPFGLHDMVGNVAEWCLDGHLREAYSLGQVRPGDGLRQRPYGTSRSYRGGHMRSHWEEVSSARRAQANADRRDGWLGFRVARDIVR